MNPGFEEIMSIRGRGTPESGEATITGRDPVFSTCFKVGETTADGRFTLSEVECLGSCGTAPMFQLNFDYHENLTPEKIDQVLDQLP